DSVWLQNALNLARDFHEIGNVVAEAHRHRAEIVARFPSILTAAMAARIVGLDGIAPFALFFPPGLFLARLLAASIARRMLPARGPGARAAAGRAVPPVGLVLLRQRRQVAVEPFDGLADQLLDGVEILPVGARDQ